MSYLNTGKWTVPERSGSIFPPCTGFTINTISGNRAIVFGGVCVTNKPSDVYIMSFTNKSVVSVDTIPHPNN